MFSLENDHLKVSISAKGAELQQLINKSNNIDYLWSADPNYWAKKSPVLFPIVGTLKDDTYKYNGQEYHLSRHGFAREKEFNCIHQNDHSVSFQISDTSDTLKIYPFQFSFTITYSILANKLTTSYIVENTGNDLLYFSVGGHPAFKLPINNGVYEDYSLIFNEVETAGRRLISSKGLIETATTILLNETAILPLEKSLFYNDAIVLKHLNSSHVSLSSEKHPEQINFDFTGFPFLGIWASKDANFVCIEPWCGIADSVETSQDLTKKEGIESLLPNKVFTRNWSAEII